ncbi:type I polyketide synthase [Actinomycetospora sp. NBRC 106378]|uniref:type I polyketide synthase n=1 Tax=Actinomycetospora sp. NBRC 106378 TaxID=3032208 RepID=UPI0024A11FE7|nr:type I polyketide synthase [Actinomycetospora sp. NBRC 106378]GLZ55374.1 hypothetical protein Acsp07_49910 [Actinomycetospora sp. NBRC 106378]
MSRSTVPAPADHAIAVVGLALRLPGADDPASFWRLLLDGTDAAGRRPDVEALDADFFGLAPREAAETDPQQRLLLELAWEACEDAGVRPADLRGGDAAVVVGAMADDWQALTRERGAVSALTWTGVRRTMLANRLSRVLDLRGPSVTVDTGQSSSLVAVHQACAALRSGDCSVALVGAVQLNLDPHAGSLLERLGALSPRGRCATFDAEADGIVRGEGAVVFVLRPLADALAAGDRVRAVILGSAVNHDGGAGGLTAPDRASQAALLRRACAAARVEPGQVGYVELHGTGTRVGDPIEAGALGDVFGAARPPGDPLPVGSVKTNLGHLEGASGAAGLAKAILALEHGVLPASLHHRRTSPAIDLAALGLVVVDAPLPWRPAPGGAELVGVSAFGLGGTNAHVIVAPAPVVAPAGAAPADRPVPWLLTARTPEGVRNQADRLAARLRAAPVPADRVARALAGERTVFDHRAAVLVDPDPERAPEALAALDALARDTGHPRVVRGHATDGPLALVVPGYGGQRPGMGAALCAGSPAFARAFDEACEALADHVPAPVRDLIRSDAPGLDGMWGAGAALFAVEVGLLGMLADWGVRPTLLAGHSRGEITVALAAGVLRLEEAARFVARRGELLDQVEPGVIVAVQATEAEVLAEIAGRDDEIGLAAVNGPSSVAVSGRTAAVEDVVARFRARGRRSRRLAISCPTHSPLVAAVHGELLALTGSLDWREPRDGVVVASSLTGRLATAAELRSPEEWARHACAPVRFADAVRALHGAGARVLLETGVGAALGPAMAETLPRRGTTVLAALPDDGDDRDAPARLAGALTVHGVELRPGALAGEGRSGVGLPTYPFRRDPAGPPPAPVAPAALPDPARPALVPPPPTAPDGGPAMLTEMLAEVLAATGAALGRPARDLDPTATFNDLGIDSRLAVELVGRLADTTGDDLPTTLVFTHPTPAALAAALVPAAPSATSATSATSVPAPPVRVTDPDEAIAVVAMSCRLPGGIESPEGLWALLARGGDAITPFPDDRGWDLAALHDPDPSSPGTSYARHGGFVAGIDRFDARAFGIAPREAEAMDPQQRLVLEAAREAFERAGLRTADLRAGDTGVFLGAMAQDYGARLDDPGDGGGHRLTGGSPSLVSGRVAYTFGLAGPALTVDTACSSSLVGVHLAMQSLRAGECSLALAGGVTLLSSPGIFVDFSRQRGLAPDGRCKPFSVDADGTAWAEGVGLVLLERLGDARRNGRRVLGLLRGSAVNSDGRSNGLTAPSEPAQQDVLRLALRSAGLGPHDVDAVEAHGTGTPLGDPIEARALAAVYGTGRLAARPLWLGSLKSNVGHAQAAAGVGGLIKMVLALQHRTLPATLHAPVPTGHLDWPTSGLALLGAARPWPRDDRPRRAGVSSFGISGTNAHVIVEEAPAEPEPARAGDAPVRVWPVSGRSPEALRAQAAALAAAVRDAGTGHHDADVAWTLAGRDPAVERGVVVAASREELLAGLDELAAGAALPSVAVRHAGRTTVRGHADPDDRDVVMVFPGQGAQWIGMARDLLATSPTFRDRFEECADALAPHVDFSLRAALDGVRLDEVDVVQPTLFAVMVSLAAVWAGLGVVPSAVVGHSQGEIAAAVVAGALDLADGARVVARRSRAITAVAGTGGMASVWADATTTAALVEATGEAGAGVEIAAVNGPASTVVAGPVAALDAVIAHGEAAGVDVRRVDVDYASHTAGMEPLRERVLTEIGGITPRPATVELWSTRTGGLLDPMSLTAEHWFEGLRGTVRFAEAVGGLAAAGHRRFVEVSPHPVLTAAVAGTVGDGALVTGTLRREHGGLGQFLAAAAGLDVDGLAVAWRHLVPSGRLTDVPPTVFERRRYWTDRHRPTAAAAAATPGVAPVVHPMLSGAVDLPDGGSLLLGAVDPLRSGWLADHAVADRTLLPGTAFLDLALLAGRHVGLPAVEELLLAEPLVLDPGGAPVELRVHVAAPAADATRAVVVETRGAGGERTRHATGLLAPAVPVAAPAGPWPVDDRPTTADPAERYAALTAAGYHYGPAFRGLRRLWCDEHGGTVEVALPPAARTGAGHVVHPALLDAVLHALPHLLDGRGMVPFAFSRVRATGPLGAAARARLRSTAPDDVTLEILDDAGAVLAADLRLRSLHGAAAEVPADRAVVLRTEWTPVDLDPDATVEVGAMPVDGDPRAAGPLPPVVVVTVPPSATALSDVLGLLQRWTADPATDTSTLVVQIHGGVACEGDAVGDGGRALTPVVGLVRSAQSEHPGRIVLLDGDDSPESATVLPAALATGEPQLALRRGRVLRPRLVEVGADDGLATPAAGPWRLDVTTRGSLGDLALVPHPDAAAPLGPREVRIAVRAAGLNFRDVTVALDLLASETTMGAECAGVVVEVAPDVTDLVPGDRVLGMVARSLGPLAVADRRRLARLPAGWSFTAAAAVPIVFVTALHCLVDQGRVAPGDRVLVHTATGGVGMAAVQLARYLGAEVFATASPAKHDTVRAMGLDDAHIASSRDVAFGAAFRAATGGRGVDVVLNSLTGPALDTSLALLAPGGRFVEMGKTDLRDPAVVAAEHPGVGYTAYDIITTDPDHVGAGLATVLDLFDRGVLSPLPTTAHDVRRAAVALADLSRARHRGKLVATLPVPFDATGSVLVTGGTGGLGGVLARHLVAAHGARHLVLVSRRGPEADGAAALMDELAAAGAEAVVVACDLADRAAVEALVAAHPPTCVVHAAGVLDDALLAGLDATRLAGVSGPKLDAAWHLHEATLDLDLRGFVMFSSVVGVLGEAGQANYAAANTGLDALAAHRRALGLPAVSLSWGLWATASGMTGHLGAREVARMRRTGVAPLATADGLALFDAAVDQPWAHVVPMALDTSGTAAERVALLAELTAPPVVDPGPAVDPGPTGVPEAPVSQPPAGDDLLTLVCDQAGAVLGFDEPGAVGPADSFRELGFDSLLSIDLRNRLNAATGLRLPAEAVIEHRTPAALVAAMSQLLAA